MFSNFQWNSEIDKVLLTFDDGPNPNTTKLILNELEKHSIKSIFFCVGENLERYPEITKEILASGHEIGNHTFSHQRITKQKQSELFNTIEKVQNIAQEKYGYEIKYFRPPHGRFNLKSNKTLSEFNLINVMWSLLTYDYKNDLNIVKFALSKNLNKNSIIVLHDSNKSKDIVVDSIKTIVEEVEKKNYQIGMPSECLKSFS
jgi:peptidoglycan/xylan/chitin deacetylase (PgdA/CDA1 family)